MWQIMLLVVVVAIMVLVAALTALTAHIMNMAARAISQAYFIKKIDYLHF